jgi:hypothetical protein
MKSTIGHLTKSAVLICATILGAASIQDVRADNPKTLQITATAVNTASLFGSSPALIIDNALTNAKPTALLNVTQVWTGTTNPHPIGVFYNGTTKKWEIHNEDYAAMPLGAVFNVRVAPSTATHTSTLYASALNSSIDFTSDTHSTGNSLLLVTHYINPAHANGELSSGVALPSYTGVINFGTWAVYNEDAAPPLATAYIVADVAGEAHASVQISSPANDLGLDFLIDDKIANDNLSAIIFVTHNYNQSTEGFDSHPVGVYYNAALNGWVIFHEDETTLPSGLGFNVEVFAAASN